MARVADAVAAAKLWLVSAGAADLPYLSEGLYALVTVESDAVAAVAADESWRLYVNPDWVAEASVEDVAREVVHQVWHLLLDHAGRARDARVDSAGAEAWGRAADLAVVDALGASGVVPERLASAARALRQGRPGLSSGRFAEDYYTELGPAFVTDDDGSGSQHADGSDEPGDAEGSASDGIGRPWELPPDADRAGLEPGEADGVRRAVALAWRASEGHGRGETPGELDRWARRLTEPSIPWRHLLAQATRRGVGWTTGRTHTTYTRPNRRASSTPGVVLPGWRREAPAVACVVDTSGSVDDDLLGEALGEVEGALRALGVQDTAVTVLACDAAVQAVSRVRRASDAVLAGGGGTDLRVALAAIADLRPRPTLTVVLTDGLTPWPDAPPPGCAVVIALLRRDNTDAPETPGWATTVVCSPDDR